MTDGVSFMSYLLALNLGKDYDLKYLIKTRKITF